MVTHPIAHASARGRRLWARYKSAYLIVFIAVLFSMVGLLALGIYLNQNGHRAWNVGLSIIPMIASLCLLLHPNTLKWSAIIGTADKLTDRVSNTPREVIFGGVEEWGWLAHKLAHVVLFLQTTFVAMALKRFENVEAAVMTIVALMGIGLVTLTFQFPPRIHQKVMTTFWKVLFIVSLGIALFYPSYFQDDASRLLMGAQAKVEQQKRDSVKEKLLAKVEAGEQLTLEERMEWENLNRQEELNSLTATGIRQGGTFNKRWFGKSQQELKVELTPGRYTFQVEVDRLIQYDGGWYDLASAVLINGQSAGKPVTVGPDGKILLSFHGSQAITRAAWEQEIRYVKLIFTSY